MNFTVCFYLDEFDKISQITDNQTQGQDTNHIHTDSHFNKHTSLEIS